MTGEVNGRDPQTYAILHHVQNLRNLRNLRINWRTLS